MKSPDLDIRIKRIKTCRAIGCYAIGKLGVGPECPGNEDCAIVKRIEWDDKNDGVKIWTNPEFRA
ncbi:MAG: hypothetical protein PHX80_03965 [Candidatus Nanoarchaeia archaeon]|nr:hypothetical protein [Candidatus Nanoarchaeia archaeon]